MSRIKPGEVAQAQRHARQPVVRRTVDKGMCVGRLPGRKRKAMWVENEGIIEPLAYFVDDASYDRFRALLSGTGLILA